MFPVPPKPIEILAQEGVPWAIAEMNRREAKSINARFAELDQARARPLAAYALGRQTPADTARLTEIEEEAARLRARLKELRSIEKT